MVAVSAAHAIRVLSIDDHPLLREGIAAIIGTQQDMCLVGQAATGRDGIREYHEKKPDITLMDVRLPDMNGIDALMAIRSEAPNARVVMLSMFRGDVEIQRALKAGARGFLLKTMPPSRDRPLHPPGPRRQEVHPRRGRVRDRRLYHRRRAHRA